MTLEQWAAATDRAAQQLAGIATRTPLQRSERLSAAAGADVRLKREDLQTGRSYKVRGAYTLMSSLSPAARDAGVVCASAGNHAQGVAHACARLQVAGRIYVPRTTPRQKRDRIRALGRETVQLLVLGDTYDESAALAVDDAARTGATLVPAFDDPRTVAGQGTVAVEAIEQLLATDGRLPDLLVVPVGGGGLLSGVAAWLAARHPSVRVVGVEPAGAASATAALAAGRQVTLDQIDGFVDGAAVARIGSTPLQVLTTTGTRVVTASEGSVCVEMIELYQTDGIIAEPAGALATAALLPGSAPDRTAAVTVSPGELVICLVSGGNNDVSRYGEIAERALVHAGLKHYFLVDFPQEPGALRRFLDEALGPDDDISRFEYVKRNNRETGTALVGVETSSPGDLPGLLARMAASPLQITQLEPGSTAYGFLV